MVQQYAAWVRSGAGKDAVVSGEKLDDDGRFLAWRDGEPITRAIRSGEPLDGSLAGYFLIRAIDGR